MSRRYLQPHVHGHIVPNNQDRETAQCSEADESIKKMWSTGTVECNSVFKIEGNPVTGNNMDEAG